MQSVKNPDARLSNDMKRGTALIGTTAVWSAISVAPNNSIPIFISTFYNDSSNIIILSTTQVKLLAGKKYRLTAHIPVTLTSLGEFTCSWWNTTTGAFIGGIGRLTPSTDTSNNAITAYAEAYLVASIDTIIELRNYTTSGTISAIFNGAKVIIEEVEAYIPVLSSTTAKITQNISGTITYPLVALGAGIVESGSNTYGSYIKYSDGTLIQWGAIPLTGCTAGGTPFYYGVATCYFPTSFASISYSIGVLGGLEIMQLLAGYIL